MHIPPKDETGTRWYAIWAGNKRVRENESYCIAEIPGEYLWRQCSRLRKCGTGGLFCAQHAKMAEREGWKDDASQA